MSYHAIIERIRNSLNHGAYLVPTGHLEPSQRTVLDELAALIGTPGFEADEAREQVERWHLEGRIDPSMMYSALGVIAASPKVRDYRRAAQCASLQEMAALEIGGPDLDARLASVDRHRGVVAFLMGRYEVALECFARALERERSAENLSNVLSSLLKLGELEEARELFSRIRQAFPDHIRAGVEYAVMSDDDLLPLRDGPPV